MATYLIGDIHGCYNELVKLLKKVKFSSSKDILFLTGDLVARGYNSLDVLRYVKSLGDSVRVVLGNHDLRILSIYAGINYQKRKNDYIIPLLKASDSDELFNWLRHQSILQIDEKKKLIVTHAGIAPQWSIKIAKKCAHDLETKLKSDSYHLFLKTLFNNNHYLSSFSKRNNGCCWSQYLDESSRFLFIFNAFTRMRYCFPSGQLEISCKSSPEKAPFPLKPWFNISNQLIKEYSVVFGHWASLDGRKTPDNIYALDTGCCWGGKLTCLRWEDKVYFTQKLLKNNINKFTNQNV